MISRFADCHRRFTAKSTGRGAYGQRCGAVGLLGSAVSGPASRTILRSRSGRLHKAGTNGYLEKSYDLLTAFKDVLGKRVREVPGNYESGDLLRDATVDLETNVTTEFATENSLVLKEGALSKNAVIKIAQSFRTGTNDIDALDYVFMYLNDEKQSHSNLHHFNDVYVLDNFRPVVTNKNWRIDCGVAGYDNRLGVPPFFPTRLRFEDYIYRLWIQQDGLASAHVDAVQTHIKNNYMRNPLAMDVFNEESFRGEGSITGKQGVASNSPPIVDHIEGFPQNQLYTRQTLCQLPKILA